MSEKNKLLGTFQTHISAHEHAVLSFLVLYIQDEPRNFYFYFIKTMKDVQKVKFTWSGIYAMNIIFIHKLVYQICVYDLIQNMQLLRGLKTARLIETSVFNGN